MTEKKIRSIFMVEPTLKQRAEKLAKEEGLSFSALLRKLLLDYVGGDQTLEDQIIEVKKELAELREIKNSLAEIREIKKELGATLKRILGPEADETHASLWDGVEKRLAEAGHNQKEMDIEEDELGQ